MQGGDGGRPWRQRDGPRISETRGGFLRANDAAAGRWYSRDVAAMAAALGLQQSSVAPYFVDADAPASSGWRHCKAVATPKRCGLLTGRVRAVRWPIRWAA
jgi:cytochrome oxidase assembly protein ShyY1